MNLNDIHRGVSKYKARKRVGRGKGTGLGKTSGRGHKGQGQRAGWSRHPTFEGGQMPLVRRIPKRGFHNKHAASVAIVNLAEIDELFEAGEMVCPETLRTKRLIRGRFEVLKVLGDGELTKALKISAHRFSKSAQEKIQKAGGEAVVLPGPAPVVKNKQKSS